MAGFYYPKVFFFASLPEGLGPLKFPMTDLIQPVFFSFFCCKAIFSERKCWVNLHLSQDENFMDQTGAAAVCFSCRKRGDFLVENHHMAHLFLKEIWV